MRERAYFEINASGWTLINRDEITVLAHCAASSLADAKARARRFLDQVGRFEKALRRDLARSGAGLDPVTIEEQIEVDAGSEGYQARLDGEPRSASPYDAAVSRAMAGLAVAWQRGWSDCDEQEAAVKADEADAEAPSDTEPQAEQQPDPSAPPAATQTP